MLPEEPAASTGLSPGLPGTPSCPPRTPPCPPGCRARGLESPAQAPPSLSAAVPRGKGGPEGTSPRPPVPSCPCPGAQRRAKLPCAGQGWGRAGTPAGSEGRGASLCGAPSLGMIVLLPTHCLGGKVDELKKQRSANCTGERERSQRLITEKGEIMPTVVVRKGTEIKMLLKCKCILLQKYSTVGLSF